MKKDEDRVVLRRGRIEHAWHPVREVPRPIGSADAPSPQPGLPRAGLLRWLPLIIAGLLGAFVIGLLFALSVRAFEAQGSSMEPELSDGDGLLVARISYGEIDFGLLDWLPFYDSSDRRWGSPGRGDVIVFDSSVRDKLLVKRVIGLPGDAVRIREGQVYINDEQLDEPYAQGETTCLQTCADVLIPDGHYFVLGDNRTNSADSRQGWTVARDDVIGKVLFSY